MKFNSPKQVLFFAVLMLVTLVAGAQGNVAISGSVTDAGTGEELIGAAITVKEKPGTGAVTNAYGFYSLTLPKGTYTLVVRYVGYADNTLALVLDSNGQYNFKMQPASKELKEVEITANKNETLTKPQMGTIKMDVKEMERIPVIFGERDILKTLQLLPGVKSAGEGNSGFYVRGGGSDQNLILLDEAPVYNASHLLGFFSTFNSDAIKDVTLYKGNMPAEYGGRLSSTVDIKMKEGNDRRYVISGGIGLISSRLNIEGPIVPEKGSFMVSGRRTYADVFVKLSPNKEVRKSILYFYDLNAKGNYRIGKKDRLFVSGYFGRDKFGINSTNSFSLAYGNITGTLRWNHIFSDRFFLNTSLIVNDFDYTVSIDNALAKIGIRSVILDYNLKQDYQYYFNSRHALKFGYLTTVHTIQPGTVSTNDTSLVNQFALTRKYGWENGIYVQHEWNPVKQVQINYGLRLAVFSVMGPGTYYNYDNTGLATDSINLPLGKFGNTYVNPEPRFTISYNFLPAHSFKASYSRNTQIIHQLSNSLVGSPTDVWVMSSNIIKPEIADQVSLGYYVSLWKERLEISVEGYYKHMQNQIDYKDGAQLRGNEQIESQLVFGTGRAYGAEFYFKVKTKPVTGWVSYTLSRSERQFDAINGGKYYAAKQDRTHDLSVVAIYQVIPRLSISATFVYYTGNAVTFPSAKYVLAGSTPDPNVFPNPSLQTYFSERNAYRMPAYHRLDVGVNYDLKTRKNYEHSLSLSIYNVYARKNAYIISFEQNDDDPRKIDAVKTYLFRIVPSISYNFKFTVPQKKKPHAE